MSGMLPPAQEAWGVIRAAVEPLHSHNPNPNVLMVEPTENWQRDDAAEHL